MPDLEDQLRTDYEATTEPIDVDGVTVDPGMVIVGPFPEAAQRRSGMTTPTETRPWWRNAWAAAAAFVVVVLVGGGVVLATTGDDPTPPAAPPSMTEAPEALATPLAVAQRFIEARDAWDASATQRLFAAGATVDDFEVQAVEDYPAQYEWYEAVG